MIQSPENYAPGESYSVVFQVQIQFPWFLHGPDKSPDNPFPTQLRFTASPNFRVGNVQFPPTIEKKFSFTDKSVAVYTGTISVRANLKVSDGAPPGTLTMKGQLDFQACSANACLPPEQVPFTFPVTVAPMVDGVKTTATGACQSG